MGRGRHVRPGAVPVEAVEHHVYVGRVFGRDGARNPTVVVRLTPGGARDPRSVFGLLHELDTIQMEVPLKTKGNAKIKTGGDGKH